MLNAGEIPIAPNCGPMRLSTLHPGLERLLRPRSGHFRMESGFHSSQWYHLARLFDDAAALRPFVADLAQRIARHRIDLVCGPVAGGATLAAMIGAALGIRHVIAARFEN